MFDKILIPIDFSRGSIKALQYILTYFNREDPHIMLLYFPGYEDQKELKKYRASYAKMLEAGAYDDLFGQLIEDTSLGRWTVSQVSYDIEEATEGVDQAIINYADKGGYELVVMGTSAPGFFGAAKAGPLVVQVLHESKIPTLIIPYNIEFRGIMDHVVFGSDFQRFPEDLYKQILEFTMTHNATLHCVDVNIAHNPLLSDKKDEMGIKYTDPNVKFRLIEANSVIEGLEKYSRENDIDMVISASHTMGHVKRLFTRSYTDEMVRKLALPILAFKMNSSD